MDSLILQAVGDNVVCVDIAAVVSKFALMHEVDLEVLELQQSSQFLSQPSFILAVFSPSDWLLCYASSPGFKSRDSQTF